MNQQLFTPRIRFMNRTKVDMLNGALIVITMIRFSPYSPRVHYASMITIIAATNYTICMSVCLYIYIYALHKTMAGLEN